MSNDEWTHLFYLAVAIGLPLLFFYLASNGLLGVMWEF